MVEVRRRTNLRSERKEDTAVRIDVEAETKKGIDQVRIKAIQSESVFLALVAEDGWHYDKYDTVVDEARYSSFSHNPRGKQVRLSGNGVLRLTKAEWEQLRDMIDSELADL